MSHKIFYNKIRGLRADLCSGITPEILSKVYDKPTVEPFLKWFCAEITRANVLFEDEIKIKNSLQESGQWLEGRDLDSALEEAAKDCPELLKLVTFDDQAVENLIAESESLREIYREDQIYINTLNNSLKTYKEIESKLDEDIEEEETLLEKERIEMNKAYDDCTLILEECDESHREFSNNVESLIKVYADAAANKGIPILWTQMPLERLMEQLKLQSDHLQIYIKKQFGDNDDIHHNSSDYETFIGDNKEKRDDKKIQELMFCKSNLSAAKIDLIAAKVQEECTLAMLKYAHDIYNNGILKIPSQFETQSEILELTGKRNTLEESVTLLQEQQLYIATQQLAEHQIMKILEQDALARLERRKTRLKKLKNLLNLAREHGHVHSDLLCMLMDIQYHRLKAVGEFVADARHYLSTEYLLSSMRCDSMQWQNDEYNKMLMLPKENNAFNKLFMSMMLGDKVPSEPLSCALKKYNELLIENANKRQQVLDTYVDDKIRKLQVLENIVNEHYDQETQDGHTISFKPTSTEIHSLERECTNFVQELQADVTKIRNTLKERAKYDTSLQREKEILWQRFLADPEGLSAIYEEAKQKADQSHFAHV